MWKIIYTRLMFLKAINKITQEEFNNLINSWFDIIDQTEMDNDTSFRTDGKVTGKKVLFS